MNRKILGCAGAFLLALCLAGPFLYARQAQTQADDLEAQVAALKSSAAEAEAMLQELLGEDGQLSPSTDLTAVLKTAAEADAVMKASSKQLEAMANTGGDTPPLQAAPATPQALPQPKDEIMARDPFASQFDDPEALKLVNVGPAKPAVQVSLGGIGFGGSKGYAILNGKVFFEDENKGGVKLLEVRRREVDIMTGGTVRTLKLFDEKDLKRLKKRREDKIKESESSLLEQSKHMQSFPRRESSIS